MTRIVPNDDGRITTRRHGCDRGQRCDRGRRRERGFSLVSAIFLLVVLAALGVFAVRLNVMQSQTSTSELRAAQAFSAARAGVSWAAYRALNAGVCASATLSLTEGGSNDFSVAVQCAQSSHLEGASTVHVYVFDVRAVSGVYGRPDYVSRRLQTKITDAT